MADQLAMNNLDDHLDDQHDIKKQLATKLRLLLRDIGISDFTMGEISSLRVNQLGGLEKLVRFLEDPSNKDMIGFFTQATGAGKTILFCIIAKLLDEPTVIFVPRIDLIDQTHRALRSIGFTADDIGVFGGGQQMLGQKVLVSTYQSHISHSRKAGPYQDFFKKAKLRICDEAHRSLGDRTREALGRLLSPVEGDGGNEDLAEIADQERVIALLKSDVKSHALTLGFTATPKLAAKDVTDHFGQEIAHNGVVDMIKAGVLCKFRLEQVAGEIRTDTDFSNGRITTETEVKVLSRNGVYEKLLNSFDGVYGLMKAEGQVPRAVVSCSSIAEAYKFLDMARAKGYRAEVYTSKDPDALTRKRQREKKLQLESFMRAGKLDMIVTVDKLSEGWDFPEVNIAINARALASPARIVQFAGRALRIALNKPFAVIIEVAWQIKGHTLELADETDPDNEGGIGRPQGDSSDQIVIDDGDKMGFLEALAQLGEPIDELRTLCVKADGKPFEYIFGVSTLRSSPAEIAKTIKSRYTAKAWITLTQKERGNVAVFGLGLTAIGTIFGINTSAIGSTTAHLALGLQIWSDDHESRALIQAAIDERMASSDIPRQQTILREAITTLYTAQEWSDLTQVQKNEVCINKKKLKAIATIFGIDGNPISSTLHHLTLGIAVWAEDSEAKSLLEKQLDALKAERAKIAGLSGHELSKRLTELITSATTVDAWLEMSTAEKNAWRTADLGIIAIARAFGVTGRPQLTSVHVCLAQKIWHDDPVAQEKIKAKQRSLELVTDKDAVIAQIKTKYTATAWVELESNKARENVKVGEMGIKMLAAVLGYASEDITQKRAFIGMGLIIWPQDPDNKIIREALKVIDDLEDPIVLRAKIKKVTTPTIWVDMNAKAKLALEIDGLGIAAIARVFGITENPVSHRKAHLQLGEKIWADQAVLVKTITDALRSWEQRTDPVVITREFKLAHTAQAWSDMPIKKAARVAVNGIGIFAIAAALGVENEGKYTTTLHFAIARKIWSDDVPSLALLQKAAGAPDLLKDLAALGLAVKKVKTPAQWVAMETRDIIAFKVENLGVMTIGTAFGIHHKVSRSSKGFLELGLKIWHGDTAACTVIQEAIDLLLSIESLDKLGKAIKSRVSAQTWVDTVYAEREAFKVGPHGIKAIATAYGLAKDEVKATKGYLKLASLIWADDSASLKIIQARLDEVSTSETEATLRPKIKAVYTAQQWADMSRKVKTQFKVSGIAMAAVATVFGITKNPLATNLTHLELGRKIWEDDPIGLALINKRIDAITPTSQFGTDNVAPKKSVRREKVEALIAANWAMLDQRARRLVSGTDHEDVLQDAITVALQSAEHFAYEGIDEETLKIQFLAWFGGILSHKKMHQRRKQKEAVLTDAQAIAFDSTATSSTTADGLTRLELARVVSCLPELTETRRQVFEALFVNGDPLEEVARELGMRKSGVEAIRDQIVRVAKPE